MKILKTKRYDLFRPSGLQREIKEGTESFLKLENNMLKDGWWPSKPLIVLPVGRDGKHEITEGQHRWRIAQKHGMVIYYQIDDQRIPIEVRENSGGKPKWSLEDWMKAHIKADKNPNYKILNSIHERTRMPLSSCVLLYYEGAKNIWGLDMYGEVRSGDLRVTDTSLAESVGEIVNYCSDLGITYARKGGFIRALMYIVKTKVVEIETLKTKIKMNIGIMMKKHFKYDYMAIINEAYNYRNYPKIDFKTHIQNFRNEKKKRLSKEKKDVHEKPGGKENKKREKKDQDDGLQLHL